MHAQYPQRSEEGIRFSGSGATNSHEPPCMVWKSNPSSPKERPVLLTVKPFLQPLACVFNTLTPLDTESVLQNFPDTLTMPC